MAFKPIKQYAIENLSTTASSAVPLDTLIGKGYFDNETRQVSVYAINDDVIIKFGDSSVVADKTLTSNALSDGNFIVARGSIQLFDLERSQKYFSAMAKVGSADVWVTVGFGEEI